jgi:hypothetical protein
MANNGTRNGINGTMTAITNNGNTIGNNGTRNGINGTMTAITNNGNTIGNNGTRNGINGTLTAITAIRGILLAITVLVIATAAHRWRAW